MASSGPARRTRHPLAVLDGLLALATAATASPLAPQPQPGELCRPAKSMAFDFAREHFRTRALGPA